MNNDSLFLGYSYIVQKYFDKYKKHLKSHEEDRKHKCPKCSVSFNFEKNLRLHTASHNTDDLVCPECKKRFNRIASFKSHLTIHQDEDNLMCTQCEALFTTEAALNEHVNNDHNVDTKESLQFVNTYHQEPVTAEPDPDPDEDSKVDMKFTCRLCQAKLKTLKQLNMHMEHHNKLKSLLKLKQKKKRNAPPSREKYFKNACKTCGKKFQKPSQLLRHERVHTRDKPFVVSRDFF